MQPTHKIKRVGLFLGVAPSGGGMFQYAMSLIDALAALPNDYKVQIAYAHEAWEDILVHHALPNTRLRKGNWGLKLATISLVLRLPSFVTTRINPLVRQLKSLACDVWIFPAQDAIAAQADVPFIASIHDLMHRYEPHFHEVNGFLKYSTREHRFRHLARDSLAVLVDSEVGCLHVVESYDVPSEKVFPLPYIPPNYIWQTTDPAAFELAYQLPKKFFFYPAQFWAHKNHIRLLEATALIRQQHPDVHLIFTGGKRLEYKRIQKKIEILDIAKHVTIFDYIPNSDLSGFYSRARALVMPTFFGPTNIPPLEALACQCPIAVSGIYGMQEQLGDSALYFDPLSVESIAAVMASLWFDDSLCTKLKQNSQSRLESLKQQSFSSLFFQVIKSTNESPLK